MGYLSICVDMSGRRCLIIGGGAVAERKVATLLELGARVEIVSPRLTPDLERWGRDGSICCRKRLYRGGDLLGKEFVFVATSDAALNRSVAAAAQSLKIWVNAADDPDNCDFILPSIMRRGALIVAVSTGGGSPALARLIREELEDHLSEDYGTMLECAAGVRRELRQWSKPPTAGAWRSALGGEFRKLVARGDRSGARAYLLNRLRDDE